MKRSFLRTTILESVSLQWYINIVLIYMIIRNTCVGSFAAIVHWYMKILLFLSCLVLNHHVMLLFSQVFNLFLCNIFEHKFMLQTKKSITFQFLIIHNVVQPLKYVVLLGVGWIWWGRLWLRYKLSVFS